MARGSSAAGTFFGDDTTTFGEECTGPGAGADFGEASAATRFGEEPPETFLGDASPSFATVCRKSVLGLASS